jgi:hypothetical protein
MRFVFDRIMVKPKTLVTHTRMKYLITKSMIMSGSNKVTVCQLVFYDYTYFPRGLPVVNGEATHCLLFAIRRFKMFVPLRELL